jgi:NDP-sugar pyrophosphorylase family protein
MMAVILAGGSGVRLKPFTITIPKPLLPLGDIPILEVLLRQLSAAGFTRVVLTVGPMSPLFSASFGDGSRWRLKIEYCVEGDPLGTAGALAGVNDPEKCILVMNGDILTTIDYRALMETHQNAKAGATIAVTRREVNIDYGVVIRDGQELKEYREKPKIDYEVSMGINVVAAESLALIPAGEKFDMPDLMMAVKNSGKPVVCYPTDCYWQDIGRFEDYQRASDDFVANPSRFLPEKGA